MEQIYYRVADRPDEQIASFENRYDMIWKVLEKDEKLTLC